MASQIDFLKLYSELSLPSGCSADELKRAYRRRVAELHPDRHPGSPNNPRANERLQRLTALYGAAMEFQRRYGRLPGATGTPTPQPRPAPPRQPVAEEPQVPRTGKGSSGRIVVGAIVAGALGWGLWGAGGFGDSIPERAAVTPANAGVPAPAAKPAVPQELAIGMNFAMVRSILGEPPSIASADRWEYGPSYVEFRRGRLIDWYSSPMHPLKVSSTRPPPPRHSSD